jgi:hypothetical protein
VTLGAVRFDPELRKRYFHLVTRRRIVPLALASLTFPVAGVLALGYGSLVPCISGCVQRDQGLLL